MSRPTEEEYYNSNKMKPLSSDRVLRYFNSRIFVSRKPWQLVLTFLAINCSKIVCLHHTFFVSYALIYSVFGRHNSQKKGQ